MSNLPQPLSMLVFVVGVGAIALLGVVLMMINLYQQMIRQRVTPVDDHLLRHRPAYCRYPACNCPLDAPADAEWCARGLPHDPRGFPYDREDA